MTGEERFVVADIISALSSPDGFAASGFIASAVFTGLTVVFQREQPGVTVRSNRRPDPLLSFSAIHPVAGRVATLQVRVRNADRHSTLVIEDFSLTKSRYRMVSVYVLTRVSPGRAGFSSLEIEDREVEPQKEARFAVNLELKPVFRRLFRAGGEVEVAYVWDDWRDELRRCGAHL